MAGQHAGGRKPGQLSPAGVVLLVLWTLACLGVVAWAAVAHGGSVLWRDGFVLVSAVFQMARASQRAVVLAWGMVCAGVAAGIVGSLTGSGHVLTVLGVCTVVIAAPGLGWSVWQDARRAIAASRSAKGGA